MHDRAEILCVIVRIKEWRRQWSIRGLFRTHRDLSLVVCYISGERGGRRVPFHRRATVTIVTARPAPSALHRSIKPISTVLLHQSASLLSCCTGQEFYRVFLFVGAEKFSPTFVIIQRFPSRKSFDFPAKFHQHLRRLLFHTVFNRAVSVRGSCESLRFQQLS